MSISAEHGDREVDVDGEFDVFLGQPVIDMSVNDFEAKADVVYDVLDAWITLDASTWPSCVLDGRSMGV